MRISERSYITLCKIRELKKVDLSTLCEQVTEFNVRNSLGALKRGNLVEVAETVSKKLTTALVEKIFTLNIYTVTDKGHEAIKQFAAAAQKKKEKASKKAKESAITRVRKPLISDLSAKKQEAYQAQNWVIPERDPTTAAVITTEINGYPVKVTYGTCYSYEHYRQPADHSRYKPNPVKGILAA